MLNEKNDDDKNRKLEENNLNKEKNLDKKKAKHGKLVFKKNRNPKEKKNACIFVTKYVIIIELYFI